MTTPPSFAAQVAWVVRKDLALEVRLRARVGTVPAFAALMLLIVSFAAGGSAGALVAIGPGAVWLAILLSSTLTANESFRQEQEHGALAALLAAGLRPTALFVGKALANALGLGLLAAALLPIACALFGLDPSAAPEPAVALGRVGGALAAGVLAIAPPATLLAAMAQGPRRALVVPLLHYPMVVPALLAAVRATALPGGRPDPGWTAWMALLAAFAALFWPLCTLLAPSVLEEP